MEEKIFKVVVIAATDAGLTNIKKEDLFITWSCYILGNRKYLIGCKTNERYFEVTYNKAKDEWYVDIYKKTYNLSIADKELS